MTEEYQKKIEKIWRQIADKSVNQVVFEVKIPLQFSLNTYDIHDIDRWLMNQAYEWVDPAAAYAMGVARLIGVIGDNNYFVAKMCFDQASEYGWDTERELKLIESLRNQ